MMRLSKLAFKLLLTVPLAFTISNLLDLNFAALKAAQLPEEEWGLTASEREKLDQIIGNFHALSVQEETKTAKRLAGPDDTTIPDPFPSDPTNPGGLDPNFDWGNLDPTGSLVTRKNGSSERLAAYVMLQTLNFYGVKHYYKKDGARTDFKIVSSKNGYFMSLTKLDIAYAIREFGRYITAHLCGQATPENFYRLFSQIPEVGLRFKYDMAWALLGNNLPKEPNQIMKMGSRWSTMSKIINGTSALRTGGGDLSGTKSDVQTWSNNIKDIVNVMTQLNGLMCYVDLRPIPREEIKKRIVIKKFLQMEVELNNEYAKYKDIIDQANRQAVKDQLNTLRSPN